MPKKTAHMLVFIPHPIDSEWGIAGTVARMTHEGKNVVYVVVTNGDKGTSDPGITAKDLAAIREREQLAAAKILGVKEVLFLRYPDLGLQDTPEFRKQILKFILTYRPEVVATCDTHRQRYFSNKDHRVLGQVVLDSVWPAAIAPNEFRDTGLGLHHVKEVLLWQTEEPNCSYDITDFYDIKREAFCCHKSQIGDPVERIFSDRLMLRAMTAAERQKFRLGESFHRLDVPQRL